MKNLLKHILLAVLLVLLTSLVLFAIDEIVGHESGDIFPAVVLFMFPVYGLAMIYFYFLTNQYSALSVLFSIIFNLLLFREEVTYFTDRQVRHLPLLITAALFWAINKLLFDKILALIGFKKRDNTRLDALIEKLKSLKN